MLKAIAAAITRALRFLEMGMDFAGKIARFPFDLLAGLFGGAPLPQFKAGDQPLEAISRLREITLRPADAQRSAALSGFEQVREYVRKPEVRATIDLSGVNRDVREILLSMSDAELTALAQAGDSKIRVFSEGKDPAIFGVPHAGLARASANSQAKNPVLERFQSRIRSRVPQAAIRESVELRA